MPLRLLAYTILHRRLSYLSLLLFLKELIAGLECSVGYRWLAAGAHSVLRFDIASRHDFLNVLL